MGHHEPCLLLSIPLFGRFCPLICGDGFGDDEVLRIINEMHGRVVSCVVALIGDGVYVMLYIC